MSGTKHAGQEIYKVILVNALLLSKFFNFIIEFYINTDFINKFKCYILLNLLICIFFHVSFIRTTDLGDEEFSIVPNSYYTACTLVMPKVRLAVFSYSVHWLNSVTVGWNLQNLSLMGVFQKKMVSQVH